MDINQLSEFIGNHALLVTAFAAILLMLVGGEIRQRMSGVSNIEPFVATRLLNHENAVMIDMRTAKEYQAGHVVNAVHLPELDESSLKNLEKYRGRPLIVYCRSGQRATAFSSRLHKHGFESVYLLKGGLMAWQNANLPLTKSQG